MADFLILTILIFLINELFSIFSYFYGELFLLNNVFDFLFLVFFFFNFFSKKIEKFNFNLDLITKYYLHFLVKPNFLVNFIFIRFKQILIFLKYFRYFFLTNTIYLIFRKLNNKFKLIWRPLFKKFSYFGYFRSNRSKWIK